MTTAAFDTTSEKIATVKLLNDLFRAAGLPPAHEMEPGNPHLAIYYCVEATPVVPRVMTLAEILADQTARQA